MTSDKNSNLSLFFEPRSVAVFGSMREPQGEGLTVIRNMLNFGFAGSIYPISRSATQASGLKAYPTVNDVDGPIDLAIVVTPPTTVLPIIDECGRKGIKAAIVATEGFAETGPDGATTPTSTWSKRPGAMGCAFWDQIPWVFSARITVW